MKSYIQNKIKAVGCLKLIIYSLIVIFFIVFAVVFFIWMTNVSRQFIFLNFPEQYTEPLQSETAIELCASLQLTMEDRRCSEDSVYSFEFFPDFIYRYSRWTSREQVDNEIGKYLISCSNWIETFADGVFQDCSYDFKGDGAYTLRIRFSKGYSESALFGGSVWRTCSESIRNFKFLETSVCNPSN